jgi:hypothetical protein
MRIIKKLAAALVAITIAGTAVSGCYVGDGERWHHHHYHYY